MCFGSLSVPSAITVRSFMEPGKMTGEEAPLNELVFGAPLRKDIVHEVVRYLRAKVRQPQKTKRIWELSGSNKKPRPQKGQGKSQVGHRRNSAWVGGQKAHGPVLRDFSFGLNRKYRAMGMMIALTAKLREGNLFVFDTLASPSYKTKDVVASLVGHSILPEDPALLHPERVLAVDTELDINFEKASRNLRQVTCLALARVDVLNILKHDKLLLSAGALHELQMNLLQQYKHEQRRRAYNDGLDSFAAGQPVDGER